MLHNIFGALWSDIKKVLELQKQPSEWSMKIGVLKNFAEFTGNHVAG